VLVGEVLDGITERDRELLTAHAEGATNAELAERFGLADGNSAAVTLSRIKRRLRERFPEIAADPSHPRLY
jgi:hypothetical protein